MTETLGLIFTLIEKDINISEVSRVNHKEVGVYLLLAQSSEEEQGEEDVEDIIRELEKEQEGGGKGEEEQLEEEQMYLPYDFAEREEKIDIFKLSGYYRARIFLFSGLPWKFVNNNLQYLNPSFVQSRLRLDPTINISPSLRIRGTADLLDDIIWGTKILGSTGMGEEVCPTYSNGENIFCEFPPEPRPSRSIVIKRFWGEINNLLALPVSFKIGRQPVHYGLGIFFNDGNGFRNIWGDSHFESTRDRVSVSLKISDRVEGEIGLDFLLSELDRGENYVSPFLLPKFGTDLIEISAYLGAMYTTSRRTEIYFILPYVSVTPLHDLKLELEGNVITGNTDMPPVFGDFLRYRIFAWNLAGRIKWEPGLVRLILDGGFASGDDNPQDQKITSIPMNPDYNVGFILYEDVLARHTLFIAKEIETSLPGKGKYYLSKGGVAGSYYIMPTVGLFPFESVGTYLSVLVAFSNQKMLINPATGQSLYGKEAKKGLEGVEIDWGIKVGTENFDFGVQLGYLILGDALRSALPSAKNTFKTQLRFTYMF